MRKENIRKLGEEKREEIEEEELEEEPARASDTYNLVVFLAALLIVAGLAAFVYFRFFIPKYVTPSIESYEFNKFEIKRIGTLWQTEVQMGNRLITVPLHYGPRELRRIEIVGELDTVFNVGDIYITFDPSTPGNKSAVALAAGELSLNLAQGFEKPLIAACAKNLTEACSTRPIVDCDDEDKAVIYLSESNDTSIMFQQNCVIIRGRGENLVRAVDRLILFWYGVMKKDEIPVIGETK